MSINIAINGYGRIGRQVLKAIYEYGLENKFKVVVINGYKSPAINAHLTKYDTTHGLFKEEVSYDENHIIINSKKIKFISTRDVNEYPWKEFNVDLVLECTGAFKSKEQSMVHLNAGAKKVLISAPGAKDVDATIVYGVNHDIITDDMNVVSNASCTTNCLAPLVKAINDKIEITKGQMSTIHSYTNDQSLIDNQHNDFRRARDAVNNLIPASSGAAKAIGLVIPSLSGKFQGFAIRVPTPNVSLVDFTFNTATKTSVEEINKIVYDAANSNLKGILMYNDLQLVSTDFNHNPYASIFDATLTSVVNGDLIKTIAWYDNEWGFCCQMLNTASVMFNLGPNNIKI